MKKAKPRFNNWAKSDDFWRRIPGLLNEYQKNNKLTSVEMADLLDINIATFYKYKKYSSNWRADSMLNVISCIKVKMKDLVKGTQFEGIL